MKPNLAENHDGQYCPAWSGSGSTTNLHYCICLEKERGGGGGVAWGRKVSRATLTQTGLGCSFRVRFRRYGPTFVPALSAEVL